MPSTLGPRARSRAPRYTLASPSKQYRSLLRITSPCGIVAGDAHSLLFPFLYSQIFRSVLVLPQHRRRINTHRPPRIGSSDHRSISGPLSISLVCDSSLVSRFHSISPKAVSSAIDPFPYVSLSRSNTKNLSRSLSQSRISSGGRTSNARLPASSLRSFARPSRRVLRRFYLAYPSLSNSQVDQPSAIQHHQLYPIRFWAGLPQAYDRSPCMALWLRDYRNYFCLLPALSVFTSDIYLIPGIFPPA